MRRKLFRLLILCLAAAAIGWALFLQIYPRKIYLPSGIDKPHILLILVDTLRADHLGCYGYSRDTSPNLDAIAKRGILFKNVYTVAPWTNPTIASLFTGRFPQAIFPPALRAEAIRQALPQELSTAAELLKANGYKTIALVDHPGISPQFHYDQGFEVFIRLFEKGNPSKGLGTEAEFVLKEFVEQIDSAKGSRMFVYLHLMYPHQPYIPPAPYDKIFGTGFQNVNRREKQGIINMYDGEIRQTDDLIAKIQQSLRHRKLSKETYVLVTSDHGEGFWEHGHFEHGNSFFNELLRIPLIIAPPEDKGTSPLQVSEAVSNIDLFPTILQLAQVTPPQETAGKSLLRYITPTEDPPESNFIFSQSLHSVDINGAACLKQNMKYIYQPNLAFRPHQLYDVLKDPRERNNLVKRGENYSAMQQHLLAHLKENERKRSTLERKSLEPDAETKERLRALGYLSE